MLLAGCTTTQEIRRPGAWRCSWGVLTETGFQDVIASFARKSGNHLALERAVFLTVLHRLMRSGSDLAADRWREDYRIASSDDLDLHHFYRAMAWLGEELPAEQQDATTKLRRDAPMI